uniref:PpiC-type peptidyl-prolyl cis-trans isomerase n=1 Tax=uncultured bacterium Contig39 TaxID=1393565 RepID=W0FRG2_9BACT|nr:PpiC-type peptidyl-prolyl cis-trans isomerase [uncultured bacterium Contig39]
MNNRLKIAALCALMVLSGVAASAQRYQGIVDKSVAIVGNEMISLSDVEAQVQAQRAQGQPTDRCLILENMMQSKLYLAQARVDSLVVNQDQVAAQLEQYMANYLTLTGGEEQLEEQFGKPIYKLRQEWRTQLEEQTLAQQEQQEIAKKLPSLTPYDVHQYLDTVEVSALPVVPIKYQMSQICMYPDREAAAIAVKERLLSIRERILAGERFATLARLYSEDPGSARKGGELGMASKSIFWPAFSDAAMALKPGTISQIVETPDGFHIIEVLEKQGDMFNARHILIKPSYTVEDREKAFNRLDSLRTAIQDSTITFELAARFYSEDPATRTNGGQMADPNTGSAYFEIDQLKPQDYAVIQDLQPGEISEPIESLDNEGRDGNTVYKIVRLDKIVPAHTATFESDYTELLGLVQNQKTVEAINNFLDDKIKTSYIIIDPLFKDCEFSREGWAQKIRKDS